jgi:hypothetical protein
LSAGLDGNACMAPGVPRQRYKENLRRQAVEAAHRAEAVPGLPARFVPLPLRHILPLLRPIAPPRDETPPPPLGGIQFRRHHMHDGVGEVLEAAGMIEVEMGEHDVTHILRPKAKLLDAPKRGLLRIKLDIEQVDIKPAQAWVWLTGVFQPEAGIDQNQPAIGFDEQAMTHESAERAPTRAIHQRTADRAEGPAIEVVDAHANLEVSKGSERETLRQDGGFKVSGRVGEHADRWRPFGAWLNRGADPDTKARGPDLSDIGWIAGRHLRL